MAKATPIQSFLPTEHVLGASGPDDDLSPQGGHADLNARVSILRQLPGEELVQLCVEHTICHELQETNMIDQCTRTLHSKRRFLQSWVGGFPPEDNTFRFLLI